MIQILILTASLLAITFFMVNLIKAKRNGRMTDFLRDLFVIFLGLVMTAGIFYIAIRVVSRVFM
tara:strand:- start:876 stop:1067 length:192 start_codon:yes stop_codon:yes gene_type:complete